MPETSSLLKLKLPDELHHGIDKLLETKKVTDEKDWNSHIPIIMDFIKSEVKEQKRFVDAMEDDRRREWDTLNDIFLDVLEKV